MNTYEITTGRFWDRLMRLLGIAYSGGDCGRSPEAVNNPRMQSLPFVGPIPEGLYIIMEPVDTITHGPYFMPLSPDPGNLMWGRSAFGIHGDSIVNPGRKAASEGCITGLTKLVRKRIWESGDHDLRVIAQINEEITQ